MKPPFSQLATFLNAPPKDVRVFLIYGPDTGLAHERAEDLVQKLVPDVKDPFAVTALSGAELGSDTAQLLDEMAAMPMTGGRKLVRLHQAIESNAGPLADFLKNPCSGDSALVIEAGDLQKKSKLRSLCEGSTPLAAAIACYVEDSAQRQKTISSILQNEKLSASRDVLRLLADILPPDRMAMRGEMEKLALYIKGKSEVTQEDVAAIISQAGGAEIDDFVQAVAGGNAAKTASLLDFLLAEQTPPVTLLRALQRHFTRLHLARAHMDNGASASEAVKKLTPPVFWKNEAPMIQQLNRWTTPRLEKRLAELLETEAAVKRTGTPAETLCAQLFLNMAAKG